LLYITFHVNLTIYILAIKINYV